MKKASLSLVLLMSSSWLMATENNNQTANSIAKPIEVPNTFTINTRPEIVGLWGMEIPDNKKCVEYYNFKGNNNVVIKSGSEWTTGLYDYQPSQDPAAQIPALIMQVKYDNNEKDCSGNQVDQSGEISQYFVKWQNSNTINFCANEKAEQCFAVLRRILP